MSPRLRQYIELGFEFSRRLIAQTGMQTLLIIHVFKKVCQVRLGFFKGLISMQVDLLNFDGFEKAFGLGIVQWRTPCRHADLRAGHLQALHIDVTGILHPTIGVMDPTRWWMTLAQGPIQGIKRELALEPTR